MRGVRVLRLNRLFVIAAVALGVGTTGPAMADIFSFKDEKGVVHFTNIQGLDSRYKLIRKEDGSPINPASTYAAKVFMPSQADIEKYAHIITTASKAYGVDASLVHACLLYTSDAADE